MRYTVISVFWQSTSTVDPDISHKALAREYKFYILIILMSKTVKFNILYHYAWLGHLFLKRKSRKPFIPYILEGNRRGRNNNWNVTVFGWNRNRQNNKTVQQDLWHRVHTRLYEEFMNNSTFKHIPKNCTDFRTISLMSYVTTILLQLSYIATARSWAHLLDLFTEQISGLSKTMTKECK